MNLSSKEMENRIDTIIRDYDGILPYFREFYKIQIQYTGYRAISSFKKMRISLMFNANNEESFSLLQEALSHAGALSRLFWPPKNAGRLATARGISLCKAVGLTDASPLHNRDLRNSIEHFDERMDKYLMRIDAGQFFATPIIGSIDSVDDGYQHVFKLIDFDRGVCIVLGEAFNYGEIEVEISRILNIVKDFV